MQYMWDVGHCGWVLCQDCFNVVLGGRGSPGHFLDIREGKERRRGRMQENIHARNICTYIPIIFFLSLSWVIAFVVYVG